MSKLQDDLKEIEKIRQKADKQQLEKVTMFDIDTFTEDADKVKSKFVEDVGTVKYKVLTMQDLLDIQKVVDPTEKGLRIIAVMMGKADPKVTYEKLCRLSPMVANKIVSALASELGFLTVKR